MIAGTINANGQEDSPVFGDECTNVKSPGGCLSRIGPGGGFTMEAPSGNEQLDVTMGPDGGGIVIMPGRDAPSTLFTGENPGGQTDFKYYLDFHEGEPNSIDDETLTIQED